MRAQGYAGEIQPYDMGCGEALLLKELDWIRSGPSKVGGDKRIKNWLFYLLLLTILKHEEW